MYKNANGLWCSVVSRLVAGDVCNLMTMTVAMRSVLLLLLVELVPGALGGGGGHIDGRPLAVVQHRIRQLEVVGGYHPDHRGR